MSRRLSPEQKALNKLITERANLARQESLLGTKFDLIKNRIREVDASIRDAHNALNNGGNGGHPRLNEHEKSLCRQSEKISAIKALRERLNIGIVEAKNAVIYFCETNDLVNRS